MSPSTERSRFTVVCLLAGLALTALVFLPLWDTGFTTNDDLRIATRTFCNDLLACAKSQGRFQFLLTGHLWLVPYWIDAAWWFQVVRFASVFANFVLLGLLVRRISGSGALGVLASVFALGFVQASWNHSLLTSYPVVLTTGLSLALGSGLAFVRYLETSRTGWLAASCAMLFVALSNELLLPYVVAFLALAFVYPGTKDRSTGLRAGFAIAATAAAFVAIYVGFRVAYPSAYDGTQIGGGIVGAIRVVVQYSLAALPGYYFHAPSAWKVLQPLVPAAADAPSAFSMLGATLRPEWIAKALLMAAAVVAAWPALPRGLGRLGRFGLLVAVACVFVPNLTMALSPKYQLWVASGDLAYTSTYVSHLALSAVLPLVLALLAGAGRTRPVLDRVLAAAAAAAVGYLSLATDFNNHHVALDQRLSQAKFRLIDAFLASDEFRSLAPGSTILAPSLFTQRGNLNLYPTDLDAYARWRTGRDVRIVGDPRQLPAPSGSPLHYLRFEQERFEDRQFIVFATLRDGDFATPVATDAVVFVHGADVPVVVSGFLRADDGAVAVDGIAPDEQRGAAFASRVGARRARRDGGAGLSFPIRSEAGIELDLVSVSWLARPPPLSDTTRGTIDWRAPQLPPFVASVSGMSEREAWGAWSNGPRAVVRFRRPLPHRFRLRVVGGAWGANLGQPIAFVVGPETRTASFTRTPFDAPETVEIEFAPGAGQHEIAILVPAPQTNPPDQRAIGLGLVELAIEPAVPAPAQ